MNYPKTNDVKQKLINFVTNKRMLVTAGALFAVIGFNKILNHGAAVSSNAIPYTELSQMNKEKLEGIWDSYENGITEEHQKNTYSTMQQLHVTKMDSNGLQILQAQRDPIGVLRTGGVRIIGGDVDKNGDRKLDHDEISAGLDKFIQD